MGLSAQVTLSTKGGNQQKRLDDRKKQ